ncbi:radical SAM protein [Hyphococcus luteus]|uniref:Radical SAM protein n=1 Tax=Hyphococcus luteus TaxID=2058213 RepID=A0A2S7K5W3_9PROT|nr:radical SAM protein [Marinicaulis flavus]PQA87893.1 radical SAM protein [Marinicaulis flavus]
MDGEAGVKTAAKFQHKERTAAGELRAEVPLARLETLWINTGTLCNVECAHCYIKSSPTNDRLVYLSAEEAAPFLDEARRMGAREIGFTGGEPFLNPDMIAMTQGALTRGFNVLILTNAMRPMMRPKVQEGLLSLRARFPHLLTLRVSLDHYSAEGHDAERGEGAFEASMTGLGWLQDNGFSFTIAGRGLTGEREAELRSGFAALFEARGVPLDAHDPAQLVIFPEMDAARDVPEITAACWSILGKDQADMMCATSRMLVKRKGAERPAVLSCTLLPYDEQFEMGKSLAEAAKPVKLNHPFCAQFCVLGGASCSG